MAQSVSAVGQAWRAAFGFSTDMQKPIMGSHIDTVDNGEAKALDSRGSLPRLDDLVISRFRERPYLKK